MLVICNKTVAYLAELYGYLETPRSGHPRSVRLGYGDNKTRLYSSIRSKTPVIWWRGLHIGSAQHRSHPAHRSDKFAGERSRGNHFPSSERVSLLQQLLHRPQEGWWSKTHPRSQTESRPYEMAAQDDYIEADPHSNSESLALSKRFRMLGLMASSAIAAWSAEGRWSRQTPPS